MTPPPGHGDIHVRHCLIDQFGEEQHDRALPILSADERARAARFVFPRDRLMFVAAHALLREALSEYADVPPHAWHFAANEYGKPALAGRHAGVNLTFNLAHTHGLVACVIGRTKHLGVGAGMDVGMDAAIDVGIDVESIDLKVHSLDIATRYFSPSEVLQLQACPEGERAVRFIELWTLKEAYVKAIGEGLSHPLDTFSFTLDGTDSLQFEQAGAGNAPAWQFALYSPSPLHRMAVAVGRDQRAAPPVIVAGCEPIRMTHR